MGLAEDLKIIKDAELDIELLGRENEKLCADNNDEIANLKDKIESVEKILEEELKVSGEKKLECKIGYCSFRTMPDKWEYDDDKILLWCKDFKMPYYYTKEIVRRLDLKNDIKLSKLKLKDIPGLTVTPQEPKFNYKIKR